jgi:hypothetical protein
MIIARALGVSGRVVLGAPATACLLRTPRSLCEYSARVLRQASWWPARMLVHHVTSHFTENKNVFVVLLVTSVCIHVCLRL